MRVVPVWTSDAVYLQTFDRDAGLMALIDFGDDDVGPYTFDAGANFLRAHGKEIPSGFTSCEYGSSGGASMNWGISTLRRGSFLVDRESETLE